MYLFTTWRNGLQGEFLPRRGGLTLLVENGGMTWLQRRFPPPCNVKNGRSTCQGGVLLLATSKMVDRRDEEGYRSLPHRNWQVDMTRRILPPCHVEDIKSTWQGGKTLSRLRHVEKESNQHDREGYPSWHVYVGGVSMGVPVMCRCGWGV